MPLKPDVTLYFLRHGETDWNRIQRYQGQTDTPLNDLGREQAARNGRTLKALLGPAVDSLEFTASPLARAAETMRIVRRELGLPEEPFVRDDRLKEQHFGHWEGQLYADLPKTDPQGFAARRSDPWRWTPAGGESYVMLSRRVEAWLRGLQRDTIAASHGNVSRVVRALILGMTDYRAITTLEVPQDRVLVIRNGTADWV
jgi:probable phosphoglycerate mutase